MCLTLRKLPFYLQMLIMWGLFRVRVLLSYRRLWFLYLKKFRGVYTSDPWHCVTTFFCDALITYFLPRAPRMIT